MGYEDEHITDVTQTLKDTENVLRDFIASVLCDKFGSDWEQKCGVNEDRLNKWKERKEIEKKRQESGARDERLIYYADFYDLKTIFKKHWDLFSSALGDLKTFEVWLSEMEKLRDPDAHRRELLPHQKHLILGLSGEIRTKITKYRSSQETSDSYYPRIEFASDNLGNSWKPGGYGKVRSGTFLRPGDVLEYVVSATDPLGGPLQLRYALALMNEAIRCSKWTSEKSFTFKVTDKCVGKHFIVYIHIRSSRKFHALKDWDDQVAFEYEVLPPK